MVLESISGQNKNSDRQKERFRSPIGIGVGVTIYNSFLVKSTDFVRVCKHFCSLKVLYRIGNYHEMHLPRKQK